jgi:type IV secretory pathway VirB2 component (pilin)
MSSRLSRWTPAALLIVLFAFALLLPTQTYAAALTGTGFWETPIQHIVDVLFGPVALILVMISFVGGIGFVECGEISGFTRTMVVMNLCGSILLAAKPFINSLFSV